MSTMHAHILGIRRGRRRNALLLLRSLQIQYSVFMKQKPMKNMPGSNAGDTQYGSQGYKEHSPAVAALGWHNWFLRRGFSRLGWAPPGSLAVLLSSCRGGLKQSRCLCFTRWAQTGSLVPGCWYTSGGWHRGSLWHIAGQGTAGCKGVTHWSMHVPHKSHAAMAGRGSITTSHQIRQNRRTVRHNRISHCQFGRVSSHPKIRLKNGRSRLQKFTPIAEVPRSARLNAKASNWPLRLCILCRSANK